jgi:hypothetical protein
MRSDPPRQGEACLLPPLAAPCVPSPRSPPSDSLAACISLAIFHKLARHAPTVDEYSTVNDSVAQLYTQNLRKADSPCPSQSLNDLSAQRDVYAVYCQGRRSDVGSDKLRHTLNALVSPNFTYITFRFG